ncbi:cupin domain-containing protein [Nonomuraea roseola]|uniref:Cupin domain-containing protein n=1 Tax=Nonomuraea roseola TaxID=46179 RepID=A0ABV5Q726_9ACTN
MTYLDDAYTVAMPPAVAKPTSLTGQRESTLELWREGGAETGVWECEPGNFTAVRDGFHEICQILSGSATLTTADGQVTELGPGSTVVLPDGWQGTWVVHEKLRKIYVTIEH